MKDIAKFTRIVMMCASVVMGVIMGILFFRAALRLDAAEDTFIYHIPFAAMLAHIPVSFHISDFLFQRYMGFPPLPEFCQGILWKISGSLNAVGLVNYIAFCIFLFFCHTKLRAKFWIVSLIALTSPMVLIHTTVGYIDLFGNSFLAIGACALLAMFYSDKPDDMSLLLWGLTGLVCAAWSKFQMAPLCAVFFLLYAVVQIAGGSLDRRKKDLHKRIALIVIFIVIASMPYLKNTLKFGNPFWPVAIPHFEEVFPYSEDSRNSRNQIYPELSRLNNFSRFFVSFFEVYNESGNGGKERWNIDQGGRLITTRAFRMGGFWNVAVIIFNSSLFLMAVLCNTRKGVVIIAAILILYCGVALLPQSYELRYYQFLPLSWAGAIGMIFPDFIRKYSKTGIFSLAVFFFLFLHISMVNRNYFRIERVEYLDLARRLGFDNIWKNLTPGKTYCVQSQTAETIFLTGPTLTEFNIVVAGNALDPCPNNGERIGLNE